MLWCSLNEEKSYREFVPEFPTTTKAAPTKWAWIVCLWEQNVPIKNIAQKLSLTEDTVHCTFNKYNEGHNFLLYPTMSRSPQQVIQAQHVPCYSKDSNGDEKETVMLIGCLMQLADKRRCIRLPY